MARLVITAVVFEKRPVREVARDYGVSRSWVYELVARYRSDGETAFEPRSRRPRTSPTKTPDEVIDLIVATRRRLAGEGLDAGMGTIRWHLAHHHRVTVSESTIHRTLVAGGLVTPAPRKRPRNSYVRFQAEQPNECWQADMTHVRLADGVDVEVLSWLDDHSRYALSVTAHHRVTTPVVVDTFTDTIAELGVPASTLTDNGLYFTTRFAGGGSGGRNGFEALLVRLCVVQKNSRPNHPTTCGKVERFQQTMKKWLSAQRPPAGIAELQQLLDRFIVDYNHRRPHRSLPHRSPPALAYAARPKAAPAGRDDIHHRVRRDIVDPAGKVTLRHHGRMFKIGIGPPGREPPSSCSSPISTSASSTQPPARSSAPSPSTPHAPTSPPADPSEHPENEQTRTPKRGFGSPGCLATSHGADDGNRTRVL
uniref:IS481 family transposase n=1 Tax=Ilumatobacter nonamiensis TaxID=467093 RepID=UPI0019D34CF0